MSNTLHALSTKLASQLHNLEHRLLKTREEITHYRQNISTIQQKLATSSSMPAVIIPEQEMAHMHFMMQQQQQQHELQTKILSLQSDEEDLQLEQVRLNTQLKLLERKQSVREQIQHHQTMLKEQHQRDEWVLLQMASGVQP